MKELTINKTGTITEQELVDIFATPAVADYYKKNNKFKNSTAKRNTIQKAQLYCQISDNQNHTYTIYRIYDQPRPKNFAKMDSGIYKHIIPLLLDRIIQERGSITFTVGHWAREINMVNDNYYLGKNNKEELMPIIKVEDEYIYDFYDHVDGMISHYITQSLKYMHDALCIMWQECYYAIFEEVDNIDVDVNGGINQGINFVVRQMTKEEFEFYTICIGEADQELEIKNPSERYYSKKAFGWKNCLNEKLYKKNIKQVFKAYHVAPTSTERCSYIKNMFGIAKNNILTTRLVNEFKNMIMDNAYSRYLHDHDLDDSKRKYNIREEEYTKIFNKMCMIMINPKAKKIKDIKNKGLLDSYTYNLIGGNIHYDV